MALRNPILVLAFLFMAVGCGPSTGNVSGTVAYKGKPVCSGTVMLLVDGQPPHYAELKDEGAFTLKGVPVGKVRVTVSSPDPARPVMVKGETKVQPKGPPDPRWFPLPDKFANPDQSGLQYEVVRRQNVWNIELKD